MRDLLGRGFAAAPAWEAALSRGTGTSGRAPSAVVEGAGGVSWRLKAMRRGGILAPLWRARYPSASRLLATLSATLQAQARGVPTAPAIGMLIVRGPGGLARGFMAVEEIAGASDLAAIVAGAGLDELTLARVMSTVRDMHDRGVVHPDLNLGNILVAGAREATAVRVIDFDRARFTEGGVPFGDRQAAIRRLERSCAKLTGNAGPMGPGTEDRWYEVYARGDRALAARLAGGRKAGRALLVLHKLGWRKPRS
jgi:hypothetical protein